MAQTAWRKDRTDEVTEPRQLRAILPLLKARVIDRGLDYFTISFGPEYGSPTQIRIQCNMDMYDLHDGDLLTLYTEVLLSKPKGTA
jgi:hypothetical protein